MSNIITIKPFGVENGVGIRTSIFFSGCEFYCKNCFNASSWDFNNGIPYGDWVIDEISESMNINVSGISILGGEPMHDRNVNDVLTLVTKYKMKYPEKTIWLYTGYSYEELLKSNIKSHILENIDVLVDGRFVEELKDLKLRFRGSSNQRVIDLNKTREFGKVVLYE